MSLVCPERSESEHFERQLGWSFCAGRRASPPPRVLLYTLLPFVELCRIKAVSVGLYQLCDATKQEQAVPRPSQVGGSRPPVPRIACPCSRQGLRNVQPVPQELGQTREARLASASCARGSGTYAQLPGSLKSLVPAPCRSCAVLTQYRRSCPEQGKPGWGSTGAAEVRGLTRGLPGSLKKKFFDHDGARTHDLLIDTNAEEHSARS